MLVDAFFRFFESVGQAIEIIGLIFQQSFGREQVLKKRTCKVSNITEDPHTRENKKVAFRTNRERSRGYVNEIKLMFMKAATAVIEFSSKCHSV